jgi:hypothetical protein
VVWRITQLQYLLQLSLRTSENSVNRKFNFGEFMFRDYMKTRRELYL